MENPILLVAFRYVHIVAAIFAVGGLSFMLICLTPATRVLDDNFRKSLLEMVAKRFSVAQNIAIIALLVSGAYNWIVNNETYSAIRPWGQMLIGIKALLAFVMFAIVWAQMFGFIKSDNPKRWLMINVHLAAIVILLAAILRHLRLEHIAGG